MGRVDQLVGVFSPRRTRYDVWVAAPGVRHMYRGYGSTDQPLYVVGEGEGSTVTDLRVDVGGIQPFSVEGYVEVSPADADLELVVDNLNRLRVEGRVRNGGVPLKDAVFISGDSEQRLGDLEVGQEANVRLEYLNNFSPSRLPEQIMGPGPYWDDRELYRRYQFLQALFYPDGRYTSTPAAGLGGGAYLMGWAEGAPLDVEVKERQFSTVGLTLYVYELPVAGLGMGTVFMVPPALITRQVEEIAGEANVWDQGFHMGPEAKLVFRFTVWEGVSLQQVEELKINLQGSSYGSTSDPPLVSLWNHESEDWDAMGLVWGQNSIPNPNAYVPPPGEILVRLETVDQQTVEMPNLTITVKGRR